jgi:hypothetical protein
MSSAVPWVNQDRGFAPFHLTLHLSKFKEKVTAVWPSLKES